MNKFSSASPRDKKPVETTPGNTEKKKDENANLSTFEFSLATAIPFRTIVFPPHQKPDRPSMKFSLPAFDRSSGKPETTEPTPEPAANDTGTPLPEQIEKESKIAQSELFNVVIGSRKSLASEWKPPRPTSSPLSVKLNFHTKPETKDLANDSGNSEILKPSSEEHDRRSGRSEFVTEIAPEPDAGPKLQRPPSSQDILSELEDFRLRGVQAPSLWVPFLQKATDFPLKGVAPTFSATIATRIAQLIEKPIPGESASGRVLNILRCAAGDNLAFNGAHPEIQDFARILFCLPDDRRLVHLNALNDKLRIHLSPKQRHMVSQHLDRIRASESLEDVESIQGRLKEFQRALVVLNTAYPSTAYPSEWLAEEVKTLITSYTDPKQNGTERALKIFYCAAGGTILSNSLQPETLTHAKILSNLGYDARPEHIEKLYEWIGSYLTSAQREIIEKYLNIADEVKKVESIAKHQEMINDYFESIKKEKPASKRWLTLGHWALEDLQEQLKNQLAMLERLDGAPTGNEPDLQSKRKTIIK